jgi:urease accessory protein
MCCRWCGDHEPVAAAMIATALRSGAVLAGERFSATWLLDSQGLGPNHWFCI